MRKLILLASLLATLTGCATLVSDDPRYNSAVRARMRGQSTGSDFDYQAWHRIMWPEQEKKNHEIECRTDSFGTTRCVEVSR